VKRRGFIAQLAIITQNSTFLVSGFITNVKEAETSTDKR
jgi:hypothetical protein